jgi:NhaA family Na+:H+ antiporter
MPKALRKLGSYIQVFIKDSRSVGILLIISAIISLITANLSFGQQYVNFWHTEFSWAHTFLLPHSIEHFINDGLMAVFFFLVGMEIKREMQEGELSTIKQAALPVIAAIGGMLVPALIYTFFNKGTSYISGWAIPASTDIAFSLGVASLLGNRVPASLKIFLTALAIIDDLGAILIIALFYGSAIKGLFLLLAALVIGLVAYMNSRSVKFGFFHIILGISLWYFVYNSGIHSTVAGVIFAFLIPKDMLSTLEHKLHTFVNFIILPIFALANTAIILPADISGALNSSLSWGIILGLFLGKPLGIFISSFYFVKKKYIGLPADVNWKHIVGAGFLAGIGFTMSIFIASLAFSEGNIKDIAKIAVLVASLLSMIGGYFYLKSVSNKGSKIH